MNRKKEVYLVMAVSILISFWSGIYTVEYFVSKSCGKEKSFSMQLVDTTIVCNTVENIKNGTK